MYRFFATPWTAARQASLSITNSQSLFKLMSVESVMPSNYLILGRPFSSCLQSFPASGSFQMSQFFASGGQSIGVSGSTSVLLMYSGLISFRWTGWISLQSKGFTSTCNLRLSPCAVSFWEVRVTCLSCIQPQVSSVQSLSNVWLFATRELQHAKPPCPSPTPRVHTNPCP